MKKKHKILGWAVYAVLAGMFVFACTPTDHMQNKVRRQATLATLSAYHVALGELNRDCSVFPTEDAGLNALIRNPGLDGWHGPYIRGSNVYPDAWHTPIRYKLVQGYPVLQSAGADVEFGTKDDISKTHEDREQTGARDGVPAAHDP